MIISFVICDPLSKHKQLGSWLIKKIDRSSGSHFAIKKESLAGVHYYDSVWPISKKSNEQDWLKKYKVIKSYSFDVPLHLQADVISFLESLVGIKYAIPQLALIALSILLWPLRKVIYKSILNHEKALICSEYGSRFVEKFMKFILLKSHDNIGVRDMEIMSRKLHKLSNPWKDVV